jgi:hypothetical protein
MPLRDFRIRMRSPQSGEVSGTKIVERSTPPPRRSLRPRRGLSGKFSAKAARALKMWIMISTSMVGRGGRAPVYTPSLLSDNYTVLPHMPQKCAPEGESAPHWLQNRPPLTGTNRTGTYLSAEQAQIKATNQPITVQPRMKFTRKMPITSALCRPIMVGRKYRSAQRIRKVMTSLLQLEFG